jgi:hypothetical protein
VAAQGSITLEDDNPDLVYNMVHWLYTQKYDLHLRTAMTPDRLINHVKTYALANKYDLPDLKTEAKGAFDQDIIKFVVRWTELLEVIKFVYGTALAGTDLGFSKILTSFFWNNRILALSEPEVRTCVRECEGFGHDILEALIQDVLLKTRALQIRTRVEGQVGDEDVAFWMDPVHPEEMLE